MEGYDDDARCLPKIPKLFTASDSQPEVVLFSTSSETEDNNEGNTVHEIATCGTDDGDKAHQNTAPQEAPPSNAPHLTLIKDNVQSETIQRLKDIAKRVHELNDDWYNDAEKSSGQTTPTGPSIEIGPAQSLEQDQPPQPLTRSRLRSIPDARLYNLGAVYSRLQNTRDGSQAATHGSVTPRQTDLDTNSTDTFEAHETTSEDEHQAYYIFDPRSGGSAYYMYQDTDTKEGYKIEKVFFKPTSPEPGVRVYHLEASEKDQGELKQGNNETFWGLNPSHTPAVILDTESSASHEAEADTGEPLYAGGEATQSIAKKVSDRLQKIRHLREHLHVINGKGQQVPEAKGLYLIGDKDIRDVVTIVLDETLKNGHIYVPERTPTTTGSSDSRPLPRLDENSNAILVPSPIAIDPATTINLPRTSYTNINSSDMQVHTKTRGAGSDATTTVVTRRSVAEITWARAYPANYDPNSRTHCRTVSDCCSPTHGGSRSCPDNRRQSHPKLMKGEPVLRHYDIPKSTAEILADIMCNKSFEQQLRVSDGTVITSFPRLFSRDCTADWLNLPTEAEETRKRTPSTLYQHGVDAHCGLDELVSSDSPQEPPDPSMYNGSLFAANPFRANPTKLTAEGRRLPTPLAAERRLSASLSADTQRRRSTQIAGIEEEILDTHNVSRQSIIDKIKQGGHKFFHRGHFRKPTGGIPTGTTEEDPSQGAALRSRNIIVREASPELPRPVYEAMTGSRLNVPLQRQDTCSEDNEPHECVNDMSSRDISPK
ncbi:hypothetical protein F53441_3850 [Fusarium austroafricanum]|uniref:Uncharacterized protein n=1 Tax=Fusarium austroafricanum TaxID=2364996 RepID=A0A8H4KQK5_9HYPO|nr:hypothetical protein F53441_3850 [Fusarium austroafricanum]